MKDDTGFAIPTRAALQIESRPIQFSDDNNYD